MNAPAASTSGLERPRPRARSALLLAAAFGSVLFVGRVAQMPPRFDGDATDYATMLQAFTAHGTPDLRAPDHDALRRLYAAEGKPYQPSTGFAVSPRGPTLGWHFWLYPLAVVPARLAIGAGGGGLAAFPLTNAILFVGALWVVALRWRAPPAHRVAFAALAAGSRRSPTSTGCRRRSSRGRS